MSKFVELLLKDVVNKNELKKAAVATRMCCLCISLYCVIMTIAAYLDGNYGISATSVCMIIGYACVAYMTYGRKTKAVCLLFNAVTLAGNGVSIVLIGWDSGIQHFLFVLVIYNILFSRLRIAYQILVSVAICVIRLGMYFYCKISTPFYEFGFYVEIFIQVVSTVFIFANITICGINYAIENHNQENKLVKYNKKLEQIATTDPLTKLWNRYKMFEYVSEYLEKNKKKFCSICIGDIDFFKKVNDTYGHEAGDAVLIAVAQLFKSEMKNIGAVARWGGEEFIFFFEGINGDEAFEKLNALRSKLCKLEIPYEEKIIKVKMTYGLVEYDVKKSLDANIKVADDRLYQGKQNGRNQIVY